MAGIRDKNIGWKRKKLYLPVTGFAGYQINILTVGGQAAGDALERKVGVLSTQAANNVELLGATAAADKNARLQGIGNGTPRIVPVGALNISGLLLGLANDGVLTYGRIPHDIDKAFPVGVRCWWTSAAADVGDRTITFAVTYGKYAIDAALADPATALSTPILVQPPKGVALALQRTPDASRGIINAGVFLETDYFWAFKVLMGAFHADFSEAKYLLGLELDYMPNKTIGAGNTMDRD